MCISHGIARRLVRDAFLYSTKVAASTFKFSHNSSGVGPCKRSQSSAVPKRVGRKIDMRIYYHVAFARLITLSLCRKKVEKHVFRFLDYLFVFFFLLLFTARVCVCVCVCEYMCIPMRRAKNYKNTCIYAIRCTFIVVHLYRFSR